MAKIAASLVRGYRRRDRDLAPELCLAVLKQLGGDVASAVSNAVRLSDWANALTARIEPRSYCSASTFAVDYLASSILSKYPVKEFATDAERRSKAIGKFEASERACFETNRRLTAPIVGHKMSITAQSVIHTAASKIARLLGDFSWDEAEKHFGFGPGATFKVPSRRGDPYYKFRIIPEATPECGLLGLLAISRSPRWYEVLAQKVGGPVGLDNIEFVPGNRITTVPKNAKEDRTIAIEPTLNMFCQKGIGGVIRSRLKRVGVDLNDQRPNQLASRVGSVDGSLATIDLASASDTVSLELCRLLLPPDWFAAIERCRSPVGYLPDGTVIRYQKVSSMGNGFTFELESLLFWAIARAVGELFHSGGDRRLWVYGDDLVVPTTHARDIIEWLSYFGFTTNAEKTFIDGPFRESCGKHYFHGTDVTPFYVRESVDSPRRLFWFHNQVVRWLRRWDTGSVKVIDSSWHQLLTDVKLAAPPPFRKFLIPFGEEGTSDDYGDVGFVSSFDEARPTLKCRFGSYSFTGIGLGTRPRQLQDDEFFVRQLYFLKRNGLESQRWGSLLDYETDEKSGVIERDVVKLLKLTTFKWEDPYLVL